MLTSARKALFKDLKEVTLYGKVVYLLYLQRKMLYKANGNLVNPSRPLLHPATFFLLPPFNKTSSEFRPYAIFHWLVSNPRCFRDNSFAVFSNAHLQIFDLYVQEKPSLYGLLNQCP